MILKTAGGCQKTGKYLFAIRIMHMDVLPGCCRWKNQCSSSKEWLKCPFAGHSFPRTAIAVPKEFNGWVQCQSLSRRSAHFETIPSFSLINRISTRIPPPKKNTHSTVFSLERRCWDDPVAIKHTPQGHAMATHTTHLWSRLFYHQGYASKIIGGDDFQSSIGSYLLPRPWIVMTS